MNPDEPDYFCARCYARLPYVQTDGETCNACDAPISAVSDYLTAEQLRAKKVEDDKRWSEAEASGLILPPRAGG